jgi:hypothetical protein
MNNSTRQGSRSTRSTRKRMARRQSSVDRARTVTVVNQIERLQTRRMQWHQALFNLRRAQLLWTPWRAEFGDELRGAFQLLVRCTLRSYVPPAFVDTIKCDREEDDSRITGCWKVLNTQTNALLDAALKILDVVNQCLTWLTDSKVNLILTKTELRGGAGKEYTIADFAYSLVDGTYAIQWKKSRQQEELSDRKLETKRRVREIMRFWELIINCFIERFLLHLDEDQQLAILKFAQDELENAMKHNPEQKPLTDADLASWRLDAPTGPRPQWPEPIDYPEFQPALSEFGRPVIPMSLIRAGKVPPIVAGFGHRILGPRLITRLGPKPNPKIRGSRLGLNRRRISDTWSRPNGTSWP